jgi:hypothetical protein
MHDDWDVEAGTSSTTQHNGRINEQDELTPKPSPVFNFALSRLFESFISPPVVSSE